MHCGVPGSLPGNGAAAAASGLCPVLRAFHRWTGGHAGRDLAGFTPPEFGKGGCRVVSPSYFNRNLRSARRWASCLIASISLLAGCKKAPTNELSTTPVAASHPAPTPPDSTPAVAPTPSVSSVNLAATVRPSGPIEFTDITS